MPSKPDRLTRVCSFAAMRTVSVRRSAQKESFGTRTYQAVHFEAHQESLRMSHLPCWSGSCDYFLLEMDAHEYLRADVACDFFAYTKFGCEHCKTAEQVNADKRLAVFATSLPPERHAKSGRIVACPSQPQLGESMLVSGLAYVVDNGEYWKA